MKKFKIILPLLMFIFSLPILAENFDLDKANAYMQKVTPALKDDQKDYSDYKEMYSQLASYNFQAEQCIQEETKNLSEISTLEHDTGLTQADSNAEDAKYIANKKKTYTHRLSQCRLFVYKSLDKMSELQTKIDILNKKKELSPSEKIWEALTEQETLITSVIVLTILIITSILTYMFLHNKIKSLHLIRVGKLTELRILKYTMLILIGGWALFLLLEWLDLPWLALQKVQNFLINGINIYDINVVPLRLILSIMTFCILQIIGKYTAMRFANQAQFNDESETNIVIGSLLKYIVLAIAIICALLIAGLDFTGLAIVAGALSVGIGFGLQNIVNNFVSGLILLLEKPIRPGDRIMVKGIEGYVAEISIRATRIISFLKEEIIFPNSDIISNPITNYVLHDTLSRMTCRVTVGYENDVELVMKLLVEIALEHPEILKDPANKPNVVLLALKENGMVFELGCTVKHIDKKYGISSEINIMIVNAFKANNISIAAPQLDIHIAD